LATPSTRFTGTGTDAIALLGEALRRLQADDPPVPPETAALVAQARAEASAEVLAARQEAAAARREAAEALAAWSELQASVDAVRRELADAQGRADELEAALAGAKDALQAEVVQHHQDLQAADHRMAAVEAIHRQQADADAAELDRCRIDAVTAEARRAMAEERAVAAERAAAEAVRMAGLHEVTAARATAVADQLRDDLTAERRRSEALQRQLGRHPAAQAPRRPVRARRSRSRQ